MSKNASIRNARLDIVTTLALVFFIAFVITAVLGPKQVLADERDATRVQHVRLIMSSLLQLKNQSEVPLEVAVPAVETPAAEIVQPSVVLEDNIKQDIVLADVLHPSLLNGATESPVESETPAEAEELIEVPIEDLADVLQEPEVVAESPVEPEFSVQSVEQFLAFTSAVQAIDGYRIMIGTGDCSGNHGPACPDAITADTCLPLENFVSSELLPVVPVDPDADHFSAEVPGYYVMVFRGYLEVGSCAATTRPIFLRVPLEE